MKCEVCFHEQNNKIFQITSLGPTKNQQFEIFHCFLYESIPHISWHAISWHATQLSSLWITDNNWQQPSTTNKLKITDEMPIMINDVINVNIAFLRLYLYNNKKYINNSVLLLFITSLNIFHWRLYWAYFQKITKEYHKVLYDSLWKKNYRSKLLKLSAFLSIRFSIFLVKITYVL